MRPTLSDVAKMAGVSVATASRALSNPDLVADSTRRAVRDAAESCGYKVNLVARSLRIQRTNTLLVLQPCIDNPFYPAILRSIEETSLTFGYSVMVGFTDKSEKHREAYADLLSNGRVDGVIIIDGGTGVEVSPARGRRFRPFRFSMSSMAAPFPPSGSMTSRWPNLPSATLPAWATAASPISRARSGRIPAADRQQGFLAAMAKLGLAVDEDLVKSGNNRRDGAAEVDEAVPDLPKPPTAVFCASDSMACAAMDVCRERGIQVPGDISFVGADDTADGQCAYPGPHHRPRAARRDRRARRRKADRPHPRQRRHSA